nr:hypothetical protein CFP56_29776 [Quercus suber]
MDSDFIERIQRITLTPKEAQPITVHTVHREKILEEYSLSLIGKFLTTRPLNLKAAKNLLHSVWKLGSNLKIVDVWGLPFDLINEEAGLDIKRGIGCMVEVECRALASDQARFLRIRVEVPLDKLIQRGGQIVSLEGDQVKVAYKYERLVGLCF